MSSFTRIPKTIVVSVDNTNQTLFTVPAGEKWIVKQLVITNQNTATQGVSLTKGSYISANTFRSGLRSLVFGETETTWYQMTFEPGETMHSTTTVGDSMVLVINLDRLITA